MPLMLLWPPPCALGRFHGKCLSLWQEPGEAWEGKEAIREEEAVAEAPRASGRWGEAGLRVDSGVVQKPQQGKEGRKRGRRGGVERASGRRPRVVETTSWACPGA